MNHEHEHWRATFYRLLNKLTDIEEDISTSHDGVKHDVAKEKVQKIIGAYLQGERAP